MIVVEGFDMSGKTTLACALIERLGLQACAHPGASPQSTMEMLEWLNACHLRMQRRLVQDRVTHISEAVYSMLREPKRAALAISRLDDLKDAKLVIYCRPPMQFMVDAIEDHDAKAYDSTAHISYLNSHSPYLIAIYDCIMGIVEDKTNMIVYDRTVPKALDRMVEYVRKVIR